MKGFAMMEMVLDSTELTPEEFEKKYGEPQVGPHGRLVKAEMMAYGDLYVYEDGYEYFFYIGD